jgi:hypothetical protein
MNEDMKTLIKIALGFLWTIVSVGVYPLSIAAVFGEGFFAKYYEEWSLLLQMIAGSGTAGIVLFSPVSQKEEYKNGLKDRGISILFSTIFGVSVGTAAAVVLYFGGVIAAGVFGLLFLFSGGAIVCLLPILVILWAINQDARRAA